MLKPTLGIIGGGQLGSLLADAAKKIEINTVILSDDVDAPAKNFSNKFINASDISFLCEVFFKSNELISLSFKLAIK